MSRRTWLSLVSVLFVTVLSAGWLLADDDDDEDGHEGGGPRLLVPVENAAWRTECAACHTLYHPALLPARSWTKIMAGLDAHFGENAALEPKVRSEITAFLTANAGDARGGLRGARIAGSIPPDQTPLRISDTMYFKRKHHEIAYGISSGRRSAARPIVRLATRARTPATSRKSA